VFKSDYIRSERLDLALDIH